MSHAGAAWDPLFGDDDVDGSIFGVHAPGAAVIDVDLGAGIPALHIPQRCDEDALETARFVWGSSVRFARILAGWALSPASPAAAPGFMAVELGAGCGLCAAALAAARRGHVERHVGDSRFAPVLATDLEMALPLLHDTVRHNGLEHHVAAAALDWQQALTDWRAALPDDTAFAPTSRPPPNSRQEGRGPDGSPLGVDAARSVALGRRLPPQAAGSSHHGAADAALARRSGAPPGADWGMLVNADLLFAADCTWSDVSRAQLLELVARACRAGAVALLMHEDRGDKAVMEKALAGLRGVTARCVLASESPESSDLYMLSGVAVKPRLDPHALAAGIAGQGAAVPVVTVSAR